MQLPLAATHLPHHSGILSLPLSLLLLLLAHLFWPLLLLLLLLSCIYRC